jgi:hypothetical protein
MAAKSPYFDNAQMAQKSVAFYVFAGREGHQTHISIVNREILCL